MDRFYDSAEYKAFVSKYPDSEIIHDDGLWSNGEPRDKYSIRISLGNYNVTHYTNVQLSARVDNCMDDKKMRLFCTSNSYDPVYSSERRTIYDEDVLSALAPDYACLDFQVIEQVTHTLDTHE